LLCTGDDGTFGELPVLIKSTAYIIAVVMLLDHSYLIVHRSSQLSGTIGLRCDSVYTVLMMHEVSLSKTHAENRAVA